jgi:hypothetical protein
MEMTKLSFDPTQVNTYRPAVRNPLQTSRLSAHVAAHAAAPTQVAESIPTPDEAPAPALTAALADDVTLEQFLKANAGLPPRTAAFGVCPDGLPVLFDLTDGRSGPILVTGDPGCGKTTLMRVLLKSASAFNAAHEVKFIVLTPKPQEFEDVANQGTRSGHCLGVHKDDSLPAEEWIFRMSALVERRLSSRQFNPPVLMVIDDLQFVNRAGADVRLNLEWILKHGPSVQIWPVVSLPTDAAAKMGRWTQHFHTRMIGKMSNAAAEHLGSLPGLEAEHLDVLQLAVVIQDHWLQFRLPKPA